MDYEVVYFVLADGGAVQEPFGMQTAARDFVQEERQSGHAMSDARLIRKSFSGRIISVEAI